jgi:hypothetical protein
MHPESGKCEIALLNFSLLLAHSDSKLGRISRTVPLEQVLKLVELARNLESSVRITDVQMLGYMATSAAFAKRVPTTVVIYIEDGERVIFSLICFVSKSNSPVKSCKCSINILK